VGQQPESADVPHHDRECAVVRGTWAETRSNPELGRGASSRPARIHSTSAWDCSAAVAARCSAVSDTSIAVTRQPRPASQMASAPSPHPTSRAVPGSRSLTSATRAPFGSPLHTCSASAYRLSQSASPRPTSFEVRGDGHVQDGHGEARESPLIGWVGHRPPSLPRDVDVGMRNMSRSRSTLGRFALSGLAGLTVVAFVATAANAFASTSRAEPTGAAAKIVRLGNAARLPIGATETGAVSSSQHVSAVMVLKPNDSVGLAAYASAVTTPGSASIAATSAPPRSLPLSLPRSPVCRRPRHCCGLRGS
jgi:hypothetical protein